jgi:hypothetical protein
LGDRDCVSSSSWNDGSREIGIAIRKAALRSRFHRYVPKANVSIFRKVQIGRISINCIVTSQAEIVVAGAVCDLCKTKESRYGNGNESAHRCHFTYL